MTSQERDSPTWKSNKKILELLPGNGARISSSAIKKKAREKRITPTQLYKTLRNAKLRYFIQKIEIGSNTYYRHRHGRVRRGEGLSFTLTEQEFNVFVMQLMLQASSIYHSVFMKGCSINRHQRTALAILLGRKVETDMLNLWEYCSPEIKNHAFTVSAEEQENIEREISLNFPQIPLSLKRLDQALANISRLNLSPSYDFIEK